MQENSSAGLGPTSEPQYPLLALNRSRYRARCPLCADIVAKVFLGGERKFLEPLMRFDVRRREGPYHLIQNRSRTSIVALKSDAAAERSKDQLSRDF
jgi:hypothetical protein